MNIWRAIQINAKIIWYNKSTVKCAGKTTRIQGRNMKCWSSFMLIAIVIYKYINLYTLFFIFRLIYLHIVQDVCVCHTCHHFNRLPALPTIVSTSCSEFYHRTVGCAVFLAVFSPLNHPQKLPLVIIRGDRHW